MSDDAAGGAARKVPVGRRRDKALLLDIRIPKVRLSSIGASAISLPSPPRMLILMATYIFLFWLMAGGIYMLVRNPIAVGAQNNQALYFYPSLNESFIIEGFIAAIMLFVGGFGAIMVYQASLSAMNKGYATALLIIGLAMTFISFMILQYIINVKLGRT